MDKEARIRAWVCTIAVVLTVTIWLIGTLTS
jgi:hypothetical protein